MARAIYPGSFDPITLGHLDIIERGCAVFDELVVAVSVASNSKRFAFSVEERQDFIRRCTASLPNVTVTCFSGLLTTFARRQGADAYLRGLRAISDFDYEFQMASMNHIQAPEVQAVFMMTRTEYSFLSSSVVREIASYGGDINHLVPAPIRDDVLAHYRRNPPQ